MHNESSYGAIGHEIADGDKEWLATRMQHAMGCMEGIRQMGKYADSTCEVSGAFCGNERSFVVWSCCHCVGRDAIHKRVTSLDIPFHVCTFIKADTPPPARIFSSDSISQEHGRVFTHR